MSLTLNLWKGMLGASFVACLFLIIGLPANGQSRHWRVMRNQQLITFDLNCSQTKSFPSATLKEVVFRSIKPEDRHRAWGDRAFILRPLRRAQPIYFVPTVCGATGNCTWRLYAANPVSYLGEIGGQFVYVYRSSRPRVIVTYTRMGSVEGILATYVFKRGKYRWLGDEYPIGSEIQPGLRADGHKMPLFLERAVRQCQDYGF